MLVDSFGRRATDLRISVTDRCNYKCTYCMPTHVDWIPKPQILTFEEIETLTRIFADLGIHEIRLTGGEPLVRRELPVLVKKLSAVSGIKEISLTTNGFYLKQHASALFEAGIHRLNVSLDSLRPDRFARITGSDSFHRVMEGIQEAKRVGFAPIKINCVAIRGFNEDEIVDFLRWGEAEDLQIRFIEYMPLDGDHTWERKKVLTQSEIVKIASGYQPYDSKQESEPSPATKFTSDDGKSVFGIIPSVSEPFCSNCSRVRLTADGKFRNCLFALQEADLRGPLRSGEPTEVLASIIRDCVAAKWAGHKIDSPDFEQPSRAMYAIGG